jgi:hypothetical protein
LDLTVTVMRRLVKGVKFGNVMSSGNVLEVCVLVWAILFCVTRLNGIRRTRENALVKHAKTVLGINCLLQRYSSASGGIEVRLCLTLITGFYPSLQY